MMFRLPQFLRKNISNVYVHKVRIKRKVKIESQNILSFDWNPIFGMSFRIVRLEWEVTNHFKN